MIMRWPLDTKLPSHGYKVQDGRGRFSGTKSGRAVRSGGDAPDRENRMSLPSERNLV